MEDVDITQYWDWPYRTKEKPIRHSSIAVPRIAIIRMALKPDHILPHTPEKIRKNARSCAVSLTSYDKKNRVFTFAVDAGHGPKTVQAALSAVDHVALSCDCLFWRYNGPEFNAKTNQFMLGQPYGNAAPPNVRDPERQYWLCKHTYAVLRRLDSFVQQIMDENWELDEKELLDTVDKEWSQLENVAEVPLEEIDIDVEEPSVNEELEVPVYVEGPEGEDILFDYDTIPIPEDDSLLEEPEIIYNYSDPELDEEESFDYSEEPEFIEPEEPEVIEPEEPEVIEPEEPAELEREEESFDYSGKQKE
jgi:hypothetical protein